MYRNCRNEHFQANMSLYDFLKFKISILSENDDVCTSDKFSEFYKMSEVSFHVIGTNRFRVKAENEKFTAVGSHYHSNLKFGTHFYVMV